MAYSIFFLFAFFALGPGVQSTPHEVTTRPSSDALIAQLEEKYSIEIVIHPQFPVSITHGKIDGREAARKHVQSYLTILSAECNLYPVELVRKTKLKRIIFCADLSFAGQLRTALPDFENNDLYLDVERGRYSQMYTRAVIHHEYFHMIDYCDDGKLYSDEEWATLNPKGFKYGTGGRNAQNDSSMSLLNESNAGFLNKYSTTGVEEDKAEIFAHMIINGALLEERAKRDTVLQTKMKFMRDLIRKFCPQADEQFWTTVRKIKR